jgi:Protein of unknown function (DUF2877)
MRLAARAIGVGVPARNLIGVIEAVHPRACLIKLAGTAGLTLLTPELGNVPGGITVEVPREFSFKRLIEVGDTLAARGGVLRTEGSALCIDLRAAHQWRSHLERLSLDLSNCGVLAAWHSARIALRATPGGISLLSLGAPYIGELAVATRSLQLAAADRAMSRLVGLGEGSTPAGDDLLVGYFAGLWAGAATIRSRLRFRTELGSRLRCLALTANRVSRIYLEAASEGEVSERLAALAGGIATGVSHEAVSAAAAAVMAVGHSSGRYGVFGLLLGCLVWQPEAQNGCMLEQKLFEAGRRPIVAGPRICP